MLPSWQKTLLRVILSNSVLSSHMTFSESDRSLLILLLHLSQTISSDHSLLVCLEALAPALRLRVCLHIMVILVALPERISLRRQLELFVYLQAHKEFDARPDEERVEDS